MMAIYLFVSRFYSNSSAKQDVVEMRMKFEYEDQLYKLELSDYENEEVVLYNGKDIDKETLLVYFGEIQKPLNAIAENIHELGNNTKVVPITIGVEESKEEINVENNPTKQNLNMDKSSVA